MRRPPSLQKGDTIYLLSTARSVSKTDIRPFTEWLSAQGFLVTYGDTIGPVHHQFAGDDQCRHEDFRRALKDESVKAIWCMRGGYGTVRMMKGITYEDVLSANKWLLGFSDVTYMHGFFQNAGLMSIHAPMGTLFQSTNTLAFEQTINLLMGNPSVVDVQQHSRSTIKQLKGSVWGGNLSMLYSMQGSSSMPFPKDEQCILFIEEIDEYLYHIDRMMWALRNSQWLNKFSAIAVGGMTDMNDHNIPFGWHAEEIIASHAAELRIPVMFGVQAGHIYNNMPILLGGYNELNTKS
ncbi:MAG: LD-carboxypeptidase [Cryomorphaceae bacterium]|nr:LD-carboxypeptidase [Cryomorphaceae bacterium]